MWPHLHLGSWTLPAYSVCVALGAVIATWLVLREADRSGFGARRALPYALLVACVGVPAARLFSALVERGLDLGTSLEAMLGGSMGMSLFGVVIFGAVFVIGVARWRRDEVPVVLDALCPGIPVAIAFGRLGCLSAGCCHGAPTLFPIALVFEDFDSAARPIGVPLHATQLYEALGCLVVLAICLRSRVRPVGRRFAETLLGYALVRLAVEPLRGDFRGDVGGWSSTLVTALALAILASWLLWRQRASVAAALVPNTNRS